MAAHVDVTTDKTAHAALSADDLISNAPLRPNESGSVPESDDRFQHRIVAARVAQLIAAGETSINIAVNGPWGSGKSTFFGLLKEELSSYKRETRLKWLLKKVWFVRGHVKDTKPRFSPIDFDAWQMADESFESNFLATVAPHVPNSPKNIEQRLFQANRSVNLPLGMQITHPLLRSVLNVLLIVALGFIVFGVPWLQVSVGAPAPLSWDDVWTKYVPAFIAWTTAAAGGTLLVVVLGVVTKLWSVTVEESGPAHVTQFRKIFTEILKRSKTTQVILVDELDRCAPAAAVRTLEGLRRFVGEDNCIFVVAFDRESVVATVNEELLRAVPHRPGRPYYSTAGEYLDKIFTYQIALPPQPRKGFRKYARDLVAEKHGGVWGELRARHGQESLDRVISILSPPHLTSPRRTKVILNDFAINARMVHSFQNSWSERADEIAVLTVLQTEFPLFYADLEHYPSLLAYVAKRVTTEPGETIAPLVRHYTEKRAEYETVFSSGIDTAPPVLDLATSSTNAVPSRNQTAPSTSSAVSIALGQQLERYLEKLRDMQVTLPLADLIQLGTGERMLQFENPAVFAAVEGATEVPRNETLRILNDASPNDQYRAVEMMLNSIEGEPSAEAMNLRGLSGSLLRTLDESRRQSLLPQVAGSWDRIIAADAISRLDDDAVLGYVHSLAPTKNQRWVEEVVRTTYFNPALLAPALSEMTARVPASTLVTARQVLVDNTISVVRDHPEVFESLIRRLDEGEGAGLKLTDAKNLAEMLSTEDIPDDDTDRLEAVETAVRTLLRFHSAMTASDSRSWLAMVFRLRAIRIADGIPEYLRVLGTDLRGEATRAGAVDEMLEALAAKATPEFKSAVAKHLVSDGVTPYSKSLLRALQALLRIVAKDALEDLTDVLAGISRIVSLIPKTTASGLSKTVDLVESAYRDPAPLSGDRFEALLSVAHSLSRIPGLTPRVLELTATLFVNAVSNDREPFQVSHAIREMNHEPAGVLRLIVDELRTDIPQSSFLNPSAVAMILYAQQRLHTLGQPVEPLTYSEIAPLHGFVGDDMVPNWIATGPHVEDIIEAFGEEEYSTISSDVWETYARRASQTNRSMLWQHLVELNEDPDVLRAVASQGINHLVAAEAAATLAAASNVEARAAGADAYLTLPQDSSTAAALVEPLLELMGQARRSDAQFVARLLIQNTESFDTAARETLGKAARRWVKQVRATLSRTSIDYLVGSGWARPTEKNFTHQNGFEAPFTA